MEEYKGKKANYDISIALKEETFIIEIYKFVSRKLYNDILYESNKDYIEKIQKNQNYYDLGKENNENIELILIEEISISRILGMKSDLKNKNKLDVKYKEEIIDKKKDKKKGRIEQSIKLDFPSAKDNKSFLNAFKNLTEIYKSQKKKK